MLPLPHLPIHLSTIPIFSFKNFSTLENLLIKHNAKHQKTLNCQSYHHEEQFDYIVIVVIENHTQK
jgi:hypothetical protein